MQQPAVGGFALDLDIPEEAGPAVLRVHGELDATNAGELEHSLTTLLTSGTPVVIDVSNVPFIDSAGLNAVVRALRSSRNAAGTVPVAVAAPVPAIARMIEIRGLNCMVGVHATVADAAAALALTA